MEFPLLNQQRYQSTAKYYDLKKIRIIIFSNKLRLLSLLWTEHTGRYHGRGFVSDKAVSAPGQGWKLFAAYAFVIRSV